MPLLAKPVHKFCTDKPAAANHNDLHKLSFRLSPVTGRVLSEIIFGVEWTAALAQARVSVIPQSLHWHYYWSALVFDQNHKEFCRRGSACVPANDMNIVGAFIVGLSWCKSDFFSALHLHHDGALQHVDKCMCIVTMDRARPAGRILYGDHQAFLAGNVRKNFRHEPRDLTLLSHQRAGYET